MAALFLEIMFSVRDKPWHGLGTIVAEAPTSADAIRLAGLDWTVVQEPIYTNFNRLAEGYRANVRSCDRKVLGVVSDRYTVVQNADAFSFTDGLLGKGVRYETAGSVRAAVTPVRVVCNNTLNLALSTAGRSFSMIHTGNIRDKIQEAKDTLFMAEKYMDCLGVEFEQLRRTADYNENLFARTADGNPLIDRACQLMKAA